MFLELVRQIAWGYSHVFKTAFGMGWSQQHASNQSCKSCLTFSLGECILSRTDTKKPHQLLFQIQLAAFAIRKTAHLLPMAKLTDALKEVNHGSWWIRSKTFTLALICIYIIHIHIYVYLRMMVCECIEMHSYRGGRKHLFVKPALLSLQVWHFNNRPDNKHAFCVLCIVYMLCTVVHTTYYCKGPHILFFLPIFIRILIIYHSSIFFECIQLYRHIINETGLHIYIYIHICKLWNMLKYHLKSVMTDRCRLQSWDVLMRRASALRVSALRFGVFDVPMVPAGPVPGPRWSQKWAPPRCTGVLTKLKRGFAEALAVHYQILSVSSKGLSFLYITCIS
jgi:hypothetical protein